MTSPGSPLTSLGPSLATALGQQPPADAGKKVLRFSDGSNTIADPDLYFPKGLASRLTNESDLSQAIILAFTMSVATAVTAAATKSAASTRA